MDRTPSSQRLTPLLVYEDIAAAHDFLVRAFGLEAGRIDRDHEGRVVHGEVYIGRETTWLHRVTSEHELVSPRSQDTASGGLAVTVDDVDAHYERARAAGARIDSAPVDQPYGRRQYGARDQSEPLARAVFRRLEQNPYRRERAGNRSLP